MQGCETMGGLVTTVVHVCVPLIRSLLNLPLPDLPAGYSSCGAPVLWEEHGHAVAFCLYCSPLEPSKMYMQLNCSGDYFPLDIRRVEPLAQQTIDEGIHLEQMSCEERLLMRARSTYEEWSGRATAAFDCPNDRVFPDVSGYPTLTVSVDGARVPSGRDFVVDSRQAVEISGTLDEVAHYAMTAGLRELSFRADGALYEVKMNSEVSAMMIFKNRACIDSRFLFAPTP
jgi:hypothetical protein